MSINSSWYSVEKGWPATAAVKLSGAFVQRRRTTGALIDACIVVFVVFTRASSFSAFLAQDPKLLRAQYSAPLFLTLRQGRHTRQ